MAETLSPTFVGMTFAQVNVKQMIKEHYEKDLLNNVLHLWAGIFLLNI